MCPAGTPLDGAEQRPVGAFEVRLFHFGQVFRELLILVRRRSESPRKWKSGAKRSKILSKRYVTVGWDMSTTWRIITQTSDFKRAVEIKRRIIAMQGEATVFIEDENGRRVDEHPLKHKRSFRAVGIAALFWLGVLTVGCGGLFLMGVLVDRVW
jgi:hypothetical protein